MKIVTSYIFPPIPVRSHDWCAYDEDEMHDGEGPTGYGATEAAALKDFIETAIEHYETLAYAEGRKDQAADEKEARYELAERERMDRAEVKAERFPCPSGNSFL